jgi:AcrR family transcriptional regulator
MPTRSEQKVETRRRILEEASRLVARQGFARTRTSDVAKKARLSHGAVFVHFPARDDLVLEVAAHLGREITDRLHSLVANGASLRDVLGAHLQCIQENEDLYRHLLLEGPTLPAAFRTTWIGIQSAVSIHISGAVEREVANGSIRATPLHLLFNTWLGLLHHYVANRDLFAPRGSVLARHGRTLLDHYLQLIAA